MKWQLKFLNIVLTGCILASCSDVFEDNIEEETVTILSPGNNTTVNTLSPYLWWEEVEGAFQYRIQVVTPAFGSNQQFIEEVITEANRIQLSLSPGEYQWRVRAENGSSETNYTIATFIVDSSISITDQEVIINSPENDFHTNEPTVTLDWSPISIAEDYTLEIGSPNINTIVLTTTLSTTSYVFEFPAEGMYEWQVRANSDDGNTEFTKQILIYDTTKPTTPTITAPATGDSIETNTPVTLTWSSDEDVLEDLIYIYNPDSLTTVTSYPIAESDQSHTFNGLSGEKYFWRVQSVDEAGNKSELSEYRFFYVK